jgi:hypothetical protein
MAEKMELRARSPVTEALLTQIDLALAEEIQFSPPLPERKRRKPPHPRIPPWKTRTIDQGCTPDPVPKDSLDAIIPRQRLCS